MSHSFFFSESALRYLLTHGLEGLDGVLFLNERNERVVLERDSMKIVELVGPAEGDYGLGTSGQTYKDQVETVGNVSNGS